MSKNVLLIDDAIITRIMLKAILKKGGYTVIGEAENGKEGVKKYIELFKNGTKADVVLLDITMPHLGGIEALKQILDFDKNAVVVMCSALKTQKSVIDSLSVGAKHFIGKPFVQDKVLETLNKVMEENNNENG